MTRRPKITVATSFPIHPARGGGQKRILGLYSAIAQRGFDIDVVALTGDRMPRGGTAGCVVAPGVREFQVPRSPEHDEAERVLHEQTGVPVTDVALALHHDLTPQYGEAIHASAETAVAVVASHPYAHPAIAASTDKPLIYEAHNVELDLKARMFEHEPETVTVVRDVEQRCCDAADAVMVCSAEDAARLGDLYDLAQSLAVLAPNGADPASIAFVDEPTRATHRRRLGLDDHFTAVFLGSWHEPNLVAVRDILRAARDNPEMRTLVIGSAGRAFVDADVPVNVDLCGMVDGRFVATALTVADVALNPMRWGSGTNLKMLDYALAGTPMASSHVGARGLDMHPGTHYAPIDPDDLSAGLRALSGEAPAAVAARVAAAHAHVVRHYSWAAIADRLLDAPGFAGVLGGVPA